MKKIVLILLVAVMPLIPYCQNTSDSLRNDSTYCFTESQVKTFVKTKIDLNTCDSLLILKNGIIHAQDEQKNELQKQSDALVEQNKINIKKQKQLKWGIGTTGVIIGGAIIYMIIRK